jgi:hypothetical protein
MEIQAQILDIKKVKERKNPENSQLGKTVCCTERGEHLRNREDYRYPLGTVRGNFDHY